MKWKAQLEIMLHKLGVKVINNSEEILQLIKNDREISLNLNNISRQISEEGNRDLVLQRNVTQILDSLNREDSALLLGDFYPRIIPDLENKSLSAPWSQVLIANHIRLAIVEDLSTHFRFLQPMNLVQHKISIHQVKDQAVNNIRCISKQLEWDIPQEGVFILERGDGLASAMLLILDEILSIEEAYFAIPSRDSLWVCTSQEELPMFVEKAKHAFNHFPYPLSPNVFSWTPMLSMQFSGRT